MLQQNEQTKANLVCCELNAEDFELYDNNIIPPGFEIGIDIRSGSAVCLDRWGKVTSSYYSPMNESYRVTIAPLN
jgi:hypothetical protein